MLPSPLPLLSVCFWNWPSPVGSPLSSSSWRFTRTSAGSPVSPASAFLTHRNLTAWAVPERGAAEGHRIRTASSHSPDSGVRGATDLSPRTAILHAEGRRPGWARPRVSQINRLCSGYAAFTLCNFQTLATIRRWSEGISWTATANRRTLHSMYHEPSRIQCL